VLDSLLVSCRALGRGVEEAFLHGLVEQARSAGAKRLCAPFVAGPRNQPMKDFLMKHGFRAVAGGDYELKLSGAPAAPEHLDLEIAG
jgi:predicted enzyme involved in methoxymalonyl-ACP biosynthesis